jgi:hypothetical protein
MMNDWRGSCSVDLEMIVGDLCNVPQTPDVGIDPCSGQLGQKMDVGCVMAGLKGVYKLGCYLEIIVPRYSIHTLSIQCQKFVERCLWISADLGFPPLSQCILVHPLRAGKMLLDVLEDSCCCTMRVISFIEDQQVT